MEKLSRAQRYAGLRESIATDREVNITTDDLNAQQNKLNSIENSFNRANSYAEQPVNQNPYVQQPVQTPVQPAYQQPVQPVYQQPVQPAYQQPVTPVYQEPVQKIEPTPVQPVQPVYAEPIKPVYQQPVQTPVQPVYTPPIQIQPTPVQPAPRTVEPVNPIPYSNYQEPVQAPVQAPVQPTQPVQPVYQAPVTPAPVIKEQVNPAPVNVQPKPVEPVSQVTSAPVLKPEPVNPAPSIDSIEDSFVNSLNTIFDTQKTPSPIEKPAKEETKSNPQTSFNSRTSADDIGSFISSLEQSTFEPEPVNPAAKTNPFEDMLKNFDPIEEMKAAPAAFTPRETVPNKPAPAVKKEENAEKSFDDFFNSLGMDIDVDDPIPVFKPSENTANSDKNSPADSLDGFDFDSFLNNTLDEADDFIRQKGLNDNENLSDLISNDFNDKPVSQEPVEIPVIETPVYVEPPHPSYVNPVNDTGNVQNGIQSPNNIQNENLLNPTMNNLVNDFLAKEPVNEHPVLTKSLEEGQSDGVEIVNLAELEKTESLTKTVTFSTGEEEEEDIDTPNKVLNVLLVVLIVALFLVLGFVVYELISANII